MTSAPTQQASSPRLAVQAFWLTLSRVIGALINIALPILLARLMSQADYGVYRQVFLFSATTVSIATLGVGISVYYYLPRYPERGGQIALNILLYNLIAGSLPLLVLLFYPDVLREVFNVPTLQPYAIPLGVIILLTLPATFLYHIPTALQDVRFSTLMIVGMELTRALIFAAVVVISPSVLNLAMAAILHQIVQNGLLVWYLHARFGRFWTQFDPALFREQLVYAAPLGAFGLIAVLQRDVHNYFVSASFGPAEYAIYSVGCLQAPMIWIFAESVTAVMVRRINELQHEGRHRDILHLTVSAINRLSAFQFPVAALLFITGRDLIVLMYTRKYEASASIFAINLIPLAAAGLIIDPIVQAYKELRGWVLAVRIVVFILTVSSLPFAIRRYGLIGAIGIAVLAFVVERSAVTWKAFKTAQVTLNDLALFRDLGKLAGVTAAGLIIASMLRDLISPDLLIPRLAVTSVTFGLIYLTGLYYLRLPGSEQLQKERLKSLAATVLAKVKGRSR